MNRVVVTGYGVISPLGKTAPDTWKNALEGITGVGPIRNFDTTDFPVKYAAEIKDFDPEVEVDRRSQRRQDRFEWLANIAAAEAIDLSGLSVNGTDPKRVGVTVSPSIGGLNTIEEQIAILTEEGAQRLNPFTIPKVMGNGAASTISIKYGFRGPSFQVASACASGSDSIGLSLQMLRMGMVDAMVTGGVEAGITKFGIGPFYRMGAYSQRTEGTPSPFSANRDGLIMGECAAVLVLETLEHAQKRGAEIYAELAGYGASSDAYHITAPAENGAGSAEAIQLALDDAKVSPEGVDYINAHGTGTALNDVSETHAVKTVFGEHAYDVPISSTKSMTGHAIGATGALEALFCVLAINDGAVPPTINYAEPDPECDLDYVPNEGRQLNVKTATTHSFGFGGHNSVLVLKAFES